ncbi:MAG: MFS transporter [Chloroflexi bacterium]|jgi:HEAT repeat protein/sugar phosphate permease|nr:MFS transporter [Chloroflexota bacterium]
MQKEWTDLEKARRLPWMIAGDAATSIFVALTFNGPAFVLFLNELGLDKGRIGFLVSLIPFCGIIAPFVAPLVARFGPKRTFITFWTVRKGVMALLLLTPTILLHMGVDGAFTWVAAIILVFGLFRAIAETGYYPWLQELVPNAIRGKFSAINNTASTVAQMLAVAVASQVVGRGTGLGRFMLLIGVGSVIGITSVICYSLLPGGSPAKDDKRLTDHIRGMGESLRDSNFFYFLASLGLVALGIAIASFIPLFMREQVGLSSGNAVLLSIGTYAGSFLSSYIWGWSADRYGSKPVMQAGLLLYALLPILWSVIPRFSFWSTPIAFVIAFIQGAAIMAWSIGLTRYLFVRAIPPSKRTSYTAVYYAWSQFVAGIGPLAIGALLDALHNLSGGALGLPIDPYTPLFALSLVLLLVALVAVSRLSADGPYSLWQFVGLFVQGKPLAALESLVQLRRATGEQERMHAARRMGDAHSLLNLQELLSSLRDPSFAVRYQALLSLTNMPAQPAIGDVLIAVLQDPSSDLRLEAAWALARMGNRRAIPTLRSVLAEQNPLLQARAVRALAALGDREAIPRFMAGLEQSTDETLRLACACALGTLHVPEAVPPLLQALRAASDASEAARAELSFALARILGNENDYVKRWQQFRDGATAAAALALRDAVPAPLQEGDMSNLLEECSRRLERGETAGAYGILRTISARLTLQAQDPALQATLAECACCLAPDSDARQEYALLMMHATGVLFQRWQVPSLPPAPDAATPPPQVGLP